MRSAAARAHLPDAARLWAIVGLAVLVSIVVYGAITDPVMRYLDRLREAYLRRREQAASS